MEEENKIKVSKEISDAIAKLRPIDDTLMRKMFEDMEFSQWVLRLLTNIEDLIVVENITQYDMDNKLRGSRSLILDLLATDKKGRKINLEVQRADRGAIPQRARYHSSAIDIDCLKAGEDFSKLPITYTIFVTENDVLKGNLALYCFENREIKTHISLNDGAHIIFANAAYDNENDNSDLAKLLHDLKCANPDDMKLEVMRNRAINFKSSEKGGYYNMCKVMEEYGDLCENRGRKEGLEEGLEQGLEKGREEATIEFVLRLLQMGVNSKEQIATATKLPLEKIEKIALQFEEANA